MIVLFTLIVIAVVAFMQYRNGLFTSVAMIAQVLIAGLVALAFWDPIADELDAYFADGKLAGYEDCMVLVGLFSLTLGGLRFVTNKLNKAMIDCKWIIQQVGGPAPLAQKELPDPSERKVEFGAPLGSRFKTLVWARVFSSYPMIHEV